MMIDKLLPLFSKLVGAVTSFKDLQPHASGALAAVLPEPYGQILLSFLGIGLLATPVIETIGEHKTELKLEEMLQLIRKQVPLHAGLQLAAEEAALQSGQKLDVAQNDARYPFVVLFNLLVDLQRGKVQSKDFEQQAIKLFRKSDEFQVQFAGFVQKEFAGLRKLIESLPPEFETLKRELDFTRDDIVELSRQLQSQTDQLSKVLENTSHYPPLRLTFDAYSYEKDHQSVTRRYLYSKRRIPFLGRKNDQDKLWQFLKSSQAPRAEKFAWWLWTGPGGAGKSRIAYELALSARIAGWQSGFLDRGRSFEDWDRWEPDRPTLIIVDYVAERARQIGAVMARLWEYRTRWQFPIRVLLLERVWSKTDPWWREFCQPDSQTDCASIESSQYAAPHAVENLSESDLRRVMELIFQEANRPLPDWGKTWQTLTSIDPQPRPLIAALLADELLVSDEAEHHWNVERLVESILRREVARWKNLGVDEYHLNLLTWSTLTGPTTIDESHQLSEQGVPVPSREMFDEAQVENLGSYSGVDYHQILPALEPDMLGECFVLERLIGNPFLSIGQKNGQSLKRTTEQLIPLGWSTSPMPMSSFMVRAFQNFAPHPGLDVFCPFPENPSGHLGWAIGAVEGFSRLLPTADESNPRIQFLSDSLWRELTRWANDSPSKLSGMALSIALTNRGARYGQTGQSELEINDFTRCIELHGVPVEEIAQALFYRGFAYSQTGQAERAIEDYTGCIELLGAPAEVIAQAYYNRGVTYALTGQVALAIEDYTRCTELPGAPVEQVARAHYNLGVAYGQTEQAALAIEYYTRCIELPGAPVEQVAKALVNRGLKQGQTGQVERAIEDYTRCIELPGAPSEVIAQALINRGLRQGQTGQAERAINDFTRCLAMPGSTVKMIAHAKWGIAVMTGHRELLAAARTFAVENKLPEMVAMCDQHAQILDSNP